MRCCTTVHPMVFSRLPVRRIQARYHSGQVCNNTREGCATARSFDHRACLSAIVWRMDAGSCLATACATIRCVIVGSRSLSKRRCCQYHRTSGIADTMALHVTLSSLSAGIRSVAAFWIDRLCKFACQQKMPA